jgi:hypothetical protein
MVDPANQAIGDSSRRNQLVFDNRLEAGCTPER